MQPPLEERPVWTRAADWFAARGTGFWALALLAVGCLIYLPRLGAYPLWDPWEPHYTQVAWEMQDRLTWNNPWYRGLDNWWSKPILLLWMLRASLAVFWDANADFINNELPARLPFALAAIAGGLLQFDWVRRLYGRTAGVLAGVILITAPQYLVIGRQVMADTPFLITYAAGLGYLAVGLFAARPAEPAADLRRAAGLGGHSFGYLIFWLLLGLGFGFAGWAPVIVALLLFAVHWTATFRWRDYTVPGGGGAWIRVVAIRGALTVVTVAIIAAIVWLAGDSPGLRLVAVNVGLLAIGFGVFWDFPHARHTWKRLRALGALFGVPVFIVAAAIPIAISALVFDGAWEPGWHRVLVDGFLAAVVPNRLLWTLVALAPLLLDRDGARASIAWLRREYAFLLFWVLMALSVLAKGFIAPTCAVMILAGYWATTFRWRDYAKLVEGREWLRYGLVRGGVALVIAGAAFAIAWYLPGVRREQRALYQGLIAAAAGAGVALAVFHDLPPVRHALRMLVRIRAAWGLIAFLAVAAPWFVYMTVEHGWPFWNEFIFYHHLGRAAGTIDKPGGTFDYFVKQIGFGLFPWTAFVAGALWKFLGRASPTRSIADRRNLYVLLAAALPYLFFTLSGTKFAHYIFPVVPMLGAMLAAVLVWLGRDGEEQVPLAEEGPALGPRVDAHPPAEPERWWERLGGRGDLVVFAAVALVIFGILAHDLVLDFRHVLRLFLYYRNRPTPPEYYPFIELQVIFFPLGIVIGSLLLVRYVSRWHTALFAAGAVALACYFSWITMPAMKDTYSFKPFVTAYEELAKPGEPIGQYNDWQQPVRSVIFLFRNRCVHLSNDKQAAAFLKRKGRKFILVDNNRLADLRRIAKDAGVRLYVVFDGHPYGRMVSDQPNKQDTRRAAEHILTELPADARHVDADFEGKIRMVGWKVDPQAVRPGESTTVELYYQCQKVMDRDWEVFVHGDGPSGGSHRIHRDHYPVEGIYLTTEWQEGEIIRDRFRLDVPADYPYAWFNLWTGWYIGNQRLALQNNPPNDGQNRVRGPRIDVRKD